MLSQHDGVRRHLVEHLARSPRLDVAGGACEVEAVRGAGAGTIVLDLSRVEQAALDGVLAAAAEVGARVVALASIRDTEQERAVLAAGGVYRLKAVGDGDLAEIILAGSSGHPASR